MPATNPARASRGSPRRRSRTPLRAAAPTITGRATVRESMFACCRVKPRQRAALSVAPFRETPGASAAAWARPSASPSAAVARSSAPHLRPAVGDEHRRGAGEQAGGGRQRPAQPPLDRPLEDHAEDRRGQEREGDHPGLAGVEGGQLLGDHPSLADQESGSRPRMERDPEAVVELGIAVVGIPAGQPGDQGEVCGAGDRKKLGRPLHGAEDDRPRPLDHEAGRSSASAAERPLISVAARERLRRISAQTIRATMAASTA